MTKGERMDTRNGWDILSGLISLPVRSHAPTKTQAIIQSNDIPPIPRSKRGARPVESLLDLPKVVSEDRVWRHETKVLRHIGCRPMAVRASFDDETVTQLMSRCQQEMPPFKLKVERFTLNSSPRIFTCFQYLP